MGWEASRSKKHPPQSALRVLRQSKEEAQSPGLEVQAEGGLALQAGVGVPKLLPLLADLCPRGRKGPAARVQKPG